MWMGEGHHGPQRTPIYVQRLRKPDDLRTAPKGEFNKIDKCVSQWIFEELINRICER